MTKRQRIRIETLTREGLINSHWNINIHNEEVLLTDSKARHMYVITGHGYLTVAPSNYSVI